MKKLSLIVAAAAIALTVVFAGCKKAIGPTFTVTFVSNGGSIVPPRIVDESSQVYKPIAPTKDSYVFAGWFTDSDFTTPAVFPYTITANVTFYAKWLLDGTPIYTAEDLDNIRGNMSGKYVLMADIDLSGDDNWTPIGTDSLPFNGQFNGNGHKITGLTIYTAPTIYVGLFGYIKDGSVSNLGVEIAANGVNAAYYVGGIAGYMDGGTITDCYTTGNISGYDAGGIVGLIVNSTITNCYTTGNIIHSGYPLEACSGGIAGLTGYSTITNCYSSGYISSLASDSPLLSKSYSGGIVGWVPSTTTIISCAAINPSVNATGITTQAGRIVGYLPYDILLIISNNLALDAMIVTGNTWQSISGTDKSAGDFKLQATYESIHWTFGTRFAAPWKMPAGGGYPIFFWQ